MFTSKVQVSAEITLGYRDGVPLIADCDLDIEAVIGSDGAIDIISCSIDGTGLDTLREVLYNRLSEQARLHDEQLRDSATHR